MALISKRRFTDTSDDVQPETYENPETSSEENENTTTNNDDAEEDVPAARPRKRRVVRAKTPKVADNEQPPESAVSADAEPIFCERL